MSSTTSGRLITRLTDHVQSKLQTAADIVGSTLNQFVVQAALERAEKVIESESTLVLSRKASLQLLEMIENPPPRNQKFLEAQAWYYRVRSSDCSPAK
ncbi:MAG: type II toxin-antitoxin system TacA family antitoxin [Burkholderiales bacterium]